jgi:hypothetical protein
MAVALVVELPTCMRELVVSTAKYCVEGPTRILKAVAEVGLIYIHALPAVRYSLPSDPWIVLADEVLVDPIVTVSAVVALVAIFTVEAVSFVTPAL